MIKQSLDEKYLLELYGGRRLKPINIEDIANELEASMDGWEQFLNVETGKFVSLSDGSYVKWDEDDERLAEEIECSKKYVRLPSQRELHEYNIMEEFAEHVLNQHKSELLFRALNGRKPFRHFKDAICDLGLDDAYYAFRFLAFCDIAARWCQDNEIPCIGIDAKEH